MRSDLNVLMLAFRMRIIPSQRYLEQLRALECSTQLLLDKKLRYVAENPSHSKRLRHERLLFVIKFSERRKAKRLILELDHDVIRPLCILDRKHDYSDLDEELKKAGY